MVLATIIGGVQVGRDLFKKLTDNREQEIREILEDLQMLLSEHQLTDEEFAILYGYIHLAKLQLMKLDDIRFILSNTLVKHHVH